MNKGLAGIELIERFRRGDRRALEELYHSLYESIFVFANSLVRDKEEAGDITAETFIKLWRLRGQFKNLANIRGFLYTSCRNACFDVLRKRQRHEISHREILYLANEEDEDDDREHMEAVLLKEIRLQVEKLPPRCREIFKLIFFKRKANAEIAEQLGISMATVHGQRSIAIRKLRIALLRNGDIGKKDT